MARRVKIHDIPRDKKVSKDEMKRVRGGMTISLDPTLGVVKPVPACMPSYEAFKSITDTYLRY
jgi:hypothetical protein